MTRIRLKFTELVGFRWYPGLDGIEFPAGCADQFQANPAIHSIITETFGLGILEEGDWIVIYPDHSFEIFAPAEFDLYFEVIPEA